MRVLAYEWKKLMIGQRGLVCLLAALVVSVCWLAATDRPQNVAMEENQVDYAWSLKTLGGPLTTQKEDWIHESSEAITQPKVDRSKEH